MDAVALQSRTLFRETDLAQETITLPLQISTDDHPCHTTIVLIWDDYTKVKKRSAQKYSSSESVF